MERDEPALEREIRTRGELESEQKTTEIQRRIKNIYAALHTE